MGVTVSEILQLPMLSEAKVIAGQDGLGQVVEYIDVLESPECIKWLKTGDLLLTTIFPLLNDPQAQKDLIRELHQAGAAAVAIKTGRFIDVIPEFMLDEANRYCLPLIELPSNIVYAELISAVSGLIINNHTAKLKKSLDINQMFTDIVKNGGTLQDIAKALSSTVGGPIIIEDDQHNVLSYSFEKGCERIDEGQILLENRRIKGTFQPLGLNQASDNIAYFPPSEKNQFGFAVAPVILKTSLIGYITLAGTEAYNEMSIMALKNATIFTALAMSAIKSTQEKEQMIKYGILYDLLYGNSYTQENVSYWTSHFHWSEDSGYLVSIIQVYFSRQQPISPEFEADSRNRTIFQALTQIVRHLVPESLIVPQKERIIMIRPVDARNKRTFEPENRHFFEQLLKKICSHSFGIQLLICVGNPCNSLMDISSSYKQAAIALEIGQKLQKLNSICYYEELDIYYIFSKFQDKSELVRFSENHLGPLLAAQVKFNALETLEAYIKTGCSLEKTAQKLITHKNTIKYRMMRIRDIMGNTLEDTAYLYKLNMAIIIHKLLSNPGHDI